MVAALASLAELGETISDEWTYVHDLEAVWTARLRALAGARGDEQLAPAVTAALGRLAEEGSRISDPHRAIDWLSTLPQAALVALGEEAW